MEMKSKKALSCSLLLLSACVSHVTKPPQPPCEPEIVERIVTITQEADSVESPIPNGFPTEDEFDDPKTAGEVMTARVVCSKAKNHRCKDKDKNYIRGNIVWHWNKRIHWASRDGKYTSKVDGSGIHDRDRPFGWVFYKRAVKAGWLTPKTCSWHKIDPHQGHKNIELQWAASWPFTSSPLSQKTLRDWIKHSHDYERWSTRGPNDGNPAYMNRFMEDRCFDPAQWDRNDVSAAGHARRMVVLCAEALAVGLPCTRPRMRCLWKRRSKTQCLKK